jgi:hypothetical protein
MVAVLMIIDRGELIAALPSYEIKGQLGEGAFGLVVAGHHRRLGRDVAIKVLAGHGAQAGFQEEARLLASWCAGQACSGGSAGLEPPDALGAGAILFSQHSGHSTCGRPCRPFSCSDAKYATPATSTKLRPPPKGRPGALGTGRGIAVHLSIDKGRRDRADRREPIPGRLLPV